MKAYHESFAYRKRVPLASRSRSTSIIVMKVILGLYGWQPPTDTADHGLLKLCSTQMSYHRYQECYSFNSRAMEERDCLPRELRNTPSSSSRSGDTCHHFLLSRRGSLKTLQRPTIRDIHTRIICTIAYPSRHKPYIAYTTHFEGGGETSRSPAHPSSLSKKALLEKLADDSQGTNDRCSFEDRETQRRDAYSSAGISSLYRACSHWVMKRNKGKRRRIGNENAKREKERAAIALKTEIIR